MMDSRSKKEARSTATASMSEGITGTSSMLAVVADVADGQRREGELLGPINF
jgi:hypothetical protein